MQKLATPHKKPAKLLYRAHSGPDYSSLELGNENLFIFGKITQLKALRG